MNILPTRLDGLKLIEPRVFADSRGFFLETYSRARYAEAGIDVEFVQDNHSRSSKGSLRGLHFQTIPGQPKLVRCARGRAYDVAVDVRPGSPTFGEWEAFELDDVNHRQLFVPVGFAHGLQALTDDVDFVYKVGSYYDPEAEVGIAWDDPDLAIPWPIRPPTLSQRDQTNQRFNAIRDQLSESTPQ